MKRLPPFAERALKHPDLPQLGMWIYTGADAWDQAKRVHAPAVVLPEDGHPEDFNWPVNGHTSLVVRTSPLCDCTFLALCKELLKAGTTHITAVKNGPLLDVESDGKITV